MKLKKGNKGSFGNVIHARAMHKIKTIPLTTALRYFDINRKTHNRLPLNSIAGKIRSNTYRTINKLSESELWDLYDKVEKNYKDKIKIIHPDRGGSTEECATINTLWDRVKILFKRLGIEKV